MLVTKELERSDDAKIRRGPGPTGEPRDSLHTVRASTLALRCRHSTGQLAISLISTCRVQAWHSRWAMLCAYASVAPTMVLVGRVWASAMRFRAHRAHERTNAFPCFRMNGHVSLCLTSPAINRFIVFMGFGERWRNWHCNWTRQRRGCACQFPERPLVVGCGKDGQAINKS